MLSLVLLYEAYNYKACLEESHTSHVMGGGGGRALLNIETKVLVENGY